ncbi:A disintegrin and metalloproteinase with thrombospondin motifs gon-1 [Frankliniella fusca]|uniref:A disintegrin and metalloproteinase with thrombospondin motifs gon-1 n=1 Tax=Frankliniella fusca TaxID=407009 RepID=A0AAE1I4K1_9NEOP|nr:A disintegrin and metalloproteinase with thrombospondin motifs gon-1 [Frankliniella fusca]
MWESRRPLWRCLLAVCVLAAPATRNVIPETRVADWSDGWSRLGSACPSESQTELRHAYLPPQPLQRAATAQCNTVSDTSR